MGMKVFSLKNSNFKNPLSALFKQIMNSIYGFLDSFLRPVIEKKIFQKKLDIFHKQMLEKNINFLIESENPENENIQSSSPQGEKNSRKNESPLQRNIDDFIENEKNEPYSAERKKSSSENKLETENEEAEADCKKSNKSYQEERNENENEIEVENLNLENQPIGGEDSAAANEKDDDLEITNNAANKVKRNKKNSDDADSTTQQEKSEEKNKLERGKEDGNEDAEAEEDIEIDTNINVISKHSLLNNAKKNLISEVKKTTAQEQTEKTSPAAAGSESELEKKYRSNPVAMQKIDLIKVKTEDIDISEFTNFDISKTSLAIFKSLIQVAEGKKKDWITSSVYSKCLGLELIAGVICQSGSVIKFIPEFTSLIKTDLHKIIKKSFESTNDYAIGLKLSRLTIQIVQKMNICYDLIGFLLKYAENQLVPWQKLIGTECVSSLLANSFLLKDLYEKKFEQEEKQRINVYDDLISTLTKISYACVTNNKPNDSKKTAGAAKAGAEGFAGAHSAKSPNKNIDNNSILTEADVIIPSYTQIQLFKLITECYAHIRDSYVIILESASLKLGVINQSFDEAEQLLSKDMIRYNYEAIKNSMTALILNSSDESITQNYLMLFQSYINIFGSIALPIARDSYLNDLCKLAIPNNLEKSLELSSKNILITKTLFNIAHCVNILDSNSWLLLIETMQKIYLMLINSNNHLIKPNEEFDIDVIIKNLETNIRKFNPNYKLKTNEDIHINRSNYNNNSNNENNNHNNESENLNNNNKNNENEIHGFKGQEETSSTSRQANNQTLNQIQITNSTQNITSHSNTEAQPEKKRGIFSTLKNALGLGRGAAKPENPAGSVGSQRKGQLGDENIDIQILSGAIDTLFINSTMYEEETLKDITKAFLESSKTILANNPIANDISNIYINFNLTKLLELAVINVHRIPLFWDSIINLISFIAQKNANNISRFALDCLTIINMFLLGEYNSGKIEFFMRSSINKQLIEKLWEVDSWQNTLFQPFKSIAQLNISQNININIIYNLSKILQNSGNFLNYQGWNNYIQICDVLVSKNDEIICENVFRLIEQIINEYADFLTLSNISCLINNLEIFAQYKKNTNISFIAITMFWNISGIAEKYIKMIKLPEGSLESSKEYIALSDYQKDFFRKNETSAERLSYISNIWIEFFSKIVGICADNLFDVRKSAINIFADIFVAKNFLIENTTAIEIINKNFLEILDKSYLIFEDKTKSNRAKKNASSSDAGQSAQLKTPKFTDVSDIKIGDFKVDQLKLPERKSNIDQEALQKLNQPSSEEVEWEDTTILLTQAIGKVLRSFLNRNLTLVTDFTFYTESLINSLIRKYMKIMRMATPKLSGTILSSLQEIYNANIDLFMNQFENLWRVYEEMGKFITTDFYLNNLCTMANSSKMISNVLEILKEIFLKESNLTLKPDLLQGRNLQNLLNFTNMLVKSSRNSEGIQTVTNPQRILFDEKIIFEFVEKVSKLLNNPNAWKIYSDFLCSYIYFDLNQHHSEAHCRKALEMFETFFSSIVAKLYGYEEENLSLDKPEVFGESDKQRSSVILEFINDHLPKLLDCVKDLCALRNKNEFVAVLIKNNKSQLQIWHYASFQLIKILSLILCRNQPKKKEEENAASAAVLASAGNSNNSIINNSICGMKKINNASENNNLNNNNVNNAYSNSNKNLIKNNNNNFCLILLDDVEINNLLNEIWESAIRCFECIFRQSEAGYKNVSRNLLEDLLKSCQDMEIQIINFIVNSLLPNSLKIPKEMQIKLLLLLDIGSNFDYNVLNNLTQTTTNTSSISRVCIENLFELCKFRTEESLKKGIFL